jgi:putative transposase
MRERRGTRRATFRSPSIFGRIVLFIALVIYRIRLYVTIPPTLPARKPNRLDASRYFGRNIYFLTFCCEHRRHVFDDPRLASSIVTTLKTVADSATFRVHAYCVMPDHLHLILEGARDDSDLDRFAKTFKQTTSFHYKRQSGEQLWQKSFYDHILRASDSLDAVLWYVWMNPVRAKLCTDPHSYAHSGSFTIEWERKEQSAAAWAPPRKDIIS